MKIISVCPGVNPQFQKKISSFFVTRTPPKGTLIQTVTRFVAPWAQLKINQNSLLTEKVNSAIIPAINKKNTSSFPDEQVNFRRKTQRKNHCLPLHSHPCSPRHARLPRMFPARPRSWSSAPRAPTRPMSSSAPKASPPASTLS